MKILILTSVIFIIAVWNAAWAGELKGNFLDTDGKVLKRFFIRDLNTATKPELASIFLKSCQPPLTYTNDGKFYCSKGTGPHQMSLSTPGDRPRLVEKLAEADLIILKK